MNLKHGENRLRQAMNHKSTLAHQTHVAGDTRDSQASPEAAGPLPWRDPCLLVSRMEDPAGCEGVRGAGVRHAFTGVVRSCRWHKTQTAVSSKPHSAAGVSHWYGSNTCSVFTQGIGVAQMWRR